MNGLFSRSPSPAVVRPLLGVALLSCVDAALTFLSPALPDIIRLIAALLSILTLLAFAAGLLGDPSDDLSASSGEEP